MRLVTLQLRPTPLANTGASTIPHCFIVLTVHCLLICVLETHPRRGGSSQEVLSLISHFPFPFRSFAC